MKEEQTEILESSHGIDPTRLNLRNKGLKSATGKLHKGCVKDAFSKLSIGSIPSNYESIIYRYEEKKGFGTSQKRFYNPNNMSQMLKAEVDFGQEMTTPIKKINASHSCKGFGPLIAKEKRQWRKYPHTPGPGKYFDKKLALECQKLHKKKMNNYTRERQDFKRKQLALNKENISNPGPGYYELPTYNNQHSPSGCKSAFLTRTNRQAYLSKNSNPGPGWYNSAESPKETRKHQPLEEELFTKLSKEKQTLTSQFLPRQKPPEVPGPGYYDQDLPNFKPLYERIKISHNFIKGSKDRLDEPLGYLQADTKTPTPCTYEVLRGYDRMEKKLIEMSSFMSESRRIVFEGGANCSQVFYDRVKDQSKNFHFNITGKWV